MAILRRPVFWLIALPIIVLLGYLAFSFFGVQYAFIDKAVSEDFPTSRPVTAAQSAPTNTPQPSATTPPTVAPTQKPAATAASTAGATPQPTTAPTATSVPPTATPIPPTEAPSEPVLIRSGNFHKVDHDVSGSALIYRQPDGTYLLRLQDFSVDNGPDLYVYLSTAADAYDAATIANNPFYSVAVLKGNVGNQNYSLPADFDPTQYNSVSIWCQRFSVNFATAPLN